MKYLELVIEIDQSGIEPALAALDMIGIDDAEVRDPRDAEEIMADKETYEWDYVDEKVAADLDKRPEISIYHKSLTEGENEAFIQSVKDAMEKLMENVEAGFYGENADFGTIKLTWSEKDDSLWRINGRSISNPSIFQTGSLSNRHGRNMSHQRKNS